MKKLYTFLNNKNIIAVIIFLISFIVYLLTLAPTISWGDSAELITVAYTLGIAHPSGYPLYILLGKLFTFLPIGSIAYRINLMSALFASLAVVLLFFIVQKISKNKSAGILASLILAFSFVFWSQAIRTEVYSLNAFFFALIILLLLKWSETNKAKFLYSTAFVYGLSFTNHLITVILLIPILFFIITGNNSLSINKKILNLKTLGIMLLFFILGLLPYLYLPLRSLKNPIIDWGNPETLNNFIMHVTGVQYKYPMFEVSINQFLKKFFEGLYYLVLQFTIFIGFGIIGIWWLWNKQKKLSIFLLIIIFLNFLISMQYNIVDIIVYYIPSYIVIAIFIGIGLAETVIFLPRYKVIFTIIIPVIMLLLSAIFFHERIYLHNDYQAYNYANLIFKILPENSVIITETDDELFPLWYMQYVEKKRDDIVIIAARMLPIQWYLDMLHKQHPELIMQSYDEISHQIFKSYNISALDMMNESYITGLFVKQTTNRIAELNKKKYRVFDISANISDIKIYNQSILKKS